MGTTRQGIVAVMAVGLAMSWAGAALAQPYPGGLPVCKATLSQCNTDLGTCEGSLEACETALAAAQQFPATGQTTAYTADKNDGIDGAVAVPDDGTVQAGTTLNYQDNGDGTITDLNTGLMWEKKDDTGGLHQWDNTYVWSGDGSQETIWDWLDDINAEGGTGFAGHSDWRIPNVKELQSIVNYQNPPRRCRRRSTTETVPPPVRC